MRKSTPVVSSGEAASYDSDSKQTIPGPVGHLAEIEEAVALAASPFSLLQPQRSIRPRKKPAELRQTICVRDYLESLSPSSEITTPQRMIRRTLWYGEPDAVENAIDYAKFFSRSHDAVIRVHNAK